VIVVDSGVLIAATDVDDNHHESCARLIAERGSEFRVADLPLGMVDASVVAIAERLDV
jgi:predicted nucleic acid-binding protein